MASSTFTFDAWDDMVASLTVSASSLANAVSAPPSANNVSAPSLAPSPSAVVSTPSTQSSGEFQPFSLIGAVLAGGGRAGRRPMPCVFPATVLVSVLGLSRAPSFA